MANLLGVGATPDQVPDSFSFPTVGDAAPGTPVTSGPVTVSGLNAPAAVTITGGEYSINGAAFTSAPGTVNNGDSVTVRVGSSGSSGGTASATLTIGGVSGTFSVTTVVFPPKTLTVSVLGSGSISSNPAGINCGTDCSESYSHGTTVTLSPTALPDHRFTGWGGACTGAGVCEITMDAPKNVTATFSPLAQRSFVAPFGADTNPCSLAAPCRTLAAALVQTRRKVP